MKVGKDSSEVMIGLQPEGYNVAEVEKWVESHVDQLSPPFRWVRLEGGHSNLTYRIEDKNGQKAVIRRPPLGQLLPKAHDMGREWAIISALGKTSVPVAPALGFCPGPEVTGAHFYIMGLVGGRALYSAEDTLGWVPEDKRKELAESFITVLANLHSLDPDSIGLEGLGKKENYIGRQLKTWYRSWNSSVEAAQYDDSRLHEMQRFLSANIPEQGPARVVHGDYGLHNCLVGSNSRISAVLDWEISTLGDPLADLAYALNQWALPEDDTPGRDNAATALPGFPSREALATLYADKTGRDLSLLNFYAAFNWCKSAMIIHGVFARYREGKKATDGVDMEDLRERIGRCIDLAEVALK